ncbi:PGPGW domain-containing protein [Streptomonospora wellingtoniae]|uniref:PGPGW domain-containing protein n=1 Tax=Streptomonospora wellingtoniae TaxID=3075544 RepID=A0ABU2KNU4_9ACTN|nr:PGPGW domain-containing protein [Streptomonospora sp. DSM 45055]MDT0300949.1 PGPGW domain-containing protein [Streptomonospora sp. DSM 45055]
MSPSPLSGAGHPDPAASPMARARRPSRRWRRFRVRLRIWRMRMHAHPVLSLTWRTVVAAVGLVVLLAGIVMCVTPGPGVAGIILGLAILATEFAWARGLLRYARSWAHRARERAVHKAQQHRRERDHSASALHPAPDSD